jgi:adenylylsulfate kinase
MTQRILIMGLPGAGKTTLADALRTELWHAGRTVTWLNADEIRKQANDWDFSPEGRLRQSHRMRELADSGTTDYVISDFVAPLIEMRNNFNARWTIWVDTIGKGRFEDTNKMFQEPEVYDFRITEQNAEKWGEFIANYIQQ